jgi:hypothetical protein
MKRVSQEFSQWRPNSNQTEGRKSLSFAVQALEHYVLPMVYSLTDWYPVYSLEIKVNGEEYEGGKLLSL